MSPSHQDPTAGADPTGFLSPTVRLRAQAARRLGYSIESLDPETGYLYEIRKGPRSRVLRGAFSPHNDAVAAGLADDKFHTAIVVRRLGLPVPEVTRCLRPGHFEREDFADHTGVEPALGFARHRGFPLIVKPAHGARGRDIAVVESHDALLAAIETVWQRDYLALVQQVVPGIDVRLDFLDDRYLFGYIRRPVSLEGDGVSPLRALLRAADRRFVGERLDRLMDDPIWAAVVAEQGWGLDTVLDAGQRVRFESTILNLNRFCVADLVPQLPEPWLAVGLRIGRALGLRHFGIDFKSPTGLDDDPEKAFVLEVNSSPSVVQMSECGYYDEALAAETAVLEAALGA